jgi:tetratricopeptide (TPR) repeat protein
MAIVYLAEHRYKEAEPLIDRALRILEAFQPSKALELSDVLNDLAALNQQTGKRLEADALYKKSIALREGTVHGKDPILAVLWQNRASLLSDLHEYEQADALYRQSLGAFERLFGSDSPRVADVLEQYAILLRKMHRKEEARQADLRIARIKSKTPDSKTSEMTIDVGALQSRAGSRATPRPKLQSGSQQ